jgi:tetratricopeptide (TPR) repeat protein
MKKISIYIILLCTALFASFEAKATPNALEQWEIGNKAYVDGRYSEAVEAYNSILESGKYSMKLYYNLANAYFKLGEMGKAILFYNKALRIAPSSEDVRHNLALAEAQTKDRIAVVPEFFLNRWLRTVRNSMSCMAWSVISLVLFGTMIAFALLFLLASRIRVRKSGFYGALCLFLLFVATTAFAVSSRNDILSHDEAIVMASAISVKSSPDRSATDIFVLHEGTKVRVVAELEEWCEVVIADGKKGWTERKNIESI